MEGEDCGKMLREWARKNVSWLTLVQMVHRKFLTRRGLPQRWEFPSRPSRYPNYGE